MQVVRDNHTLSVFMESLQYRAILQNVGDTKLNEVNDESNLVLYQIFTWFC